MLFANCIHKKKLCKFDQHDWSIIGPNSVILVPKDQIPLASELWSRKRDTNLLVHTHPVQFGLPLSKRPLYVGSAPFSSPYLCCSNRLRGPCAQSLLWIKKASDLGCRCRSAPPRWLLRNQSSLSDKAHLRQCAWLDGVDSGDAARKQSHLILVRWQGVAAELNYLQAYARSFSNSLPGKTTNAFYTGVIGKSTARQVSLKLEHQSKAVVEAW